MNYRTISAGVLSAVALLAVAAPNGMAASQAKPLEGSIAKLVTQIVPTDVDSEIGETGIAGPDLGRYAEWLRQNRGSLTSTVMGKRRDVVFKMAISRVGTGVRAGQLQK
ncbi:MAG TPA: hypothetical protein VGK19_06355 [Capsulimonadaceae bacterium]|jgi:hypothetical protein